MRIASNKISDVIRFFREELNNFYEKDEIEIFIQYCFEYFLNFKKSDILLRKNETISESELLKFNFAIKDLKQFKPIQYILGNVDFYGLKFYVNGQVLIPRNETEELVDLILNDIKLLPIKNQNLSILDIGTGSGCIPIALKKNMLAAQVYGIDVSEEALKVAKLNAELNKVEVGFILDDIINPSFKSDFLKFDIIVSNPPYISVSEKATMSKNVLDYEPHLALFVLDNDPLLFYKAIADFALKHLHKNGKLYFEINQNFGTETKLLLKNKGFKNVQLIKDLNRNNRIIKAFL